MVKPVIPNNPWLHVKAVEANVELLSTTEHVQDLKDTLIAIKEKDDSAVGLASNQIWPEDASTPPLRVFVAYLPGNEVPTAFINPKGSGSGPKIPSTEKCLSYPNRQPATFTKRRDKNYTLLYTDDLGEEQAIKYGGNTSVLLQHEMDHLMGITVYPKGSRG